MSRIGRQGLRSTGRRKVGSTTKIRGVVSPPEGCHAAGFCAQQVRRYAQESLAIDHADRKRNGPVKRIFRSIANSYGPHRNLVLGMGVRLVHSWEHRWLAMLSCATCAAVEDKKVHPVVDVWESTEAKSAHSHVLIVR